MQNRTEQQSPIFWLFLILILVSAIALAAWPAPSQADSGLPSRSTPTKSAGKDSSSGGGPAGAYIELHAQNLPGSGWSGVQWQDANGDWQAVEGWQGALENGLRRWWVHPKDFGSGPFRWAVFNSPGGALIAASEPFTLPRFPNDTLLVNVSSVN